MRVTDDDGRVVDAEEEPIRPQGHSKTQALMIVGDARDAFLAPAIGARARVIVRRIVPGRAVRGVVLAHRPPQAVGEIGTPSTPPLSRAPPGPSKILRSSWPLLGRVYRHVESRAWQASRSMARTLALVRLWVLAVLTWSPKSAISPKQSPGPSRRIGVSPCPARCFRTSTRPSSSGSPPRRPACPRRSPSSALPASLSR